MLLGDIMASNIRIGVSVDDGGSTKKLVKDANELRTSYEGAAKAAGTIRASAAAPTSTAGSRRAAEMGSGEYGRLRGSAGMTGASARDFANEAQGLGGLVRLYATYAANIFAVSAAFNALSNAMDTTNMVRGLDQLGAKSGIALGSLSKRLVDVTDGAISMREAMSSVAKASASGMNSDNILRMGKVAKQASQALGVDMSDAVNRLTRGITKLEPELLDELGIFTKVDKATSDYAKSVGKSTESLTDFEKRMAFANAVLAEGEKKFKDINMETNPYTKLLATVKDLAQAGLELVNKFFVPVVKFLAESPNALSAIMTGLVALIVKQAIPALGQMRSSIVASTRASADAAKARLDITKKLLEDEKRAQISAADAASEAASQKFEESTRKLAQLSQKRIAGLSKAGLEISQKDLTSITDADLKKLDELGAKNTQVGATYRKVAADIRAYQEAEKQGAANREAIQKKYEDGTITLRNLQRIANREALTAYSDQLTAQAALRGSTIGFTRAISDLFTNIGKARQGIATREIEEVDAQGRKYLKTVDETIPKMGRLQAAYTGLKGGVAAAAGTISTAVGALGGFMNIIGVVAGAVAILDSIFDSTSKQVGEFTKATERLSAANEMLGKTIQAAYADMPYSIQSLEAQGKAMMEVSASFDLAATSAIKAKDAIAQGNIWDKLKDGLFSVFGGGVQKNFEKGLAETIKSSIENLEDAPIATKLKETLSAILQIEDIDNFEKLKQALRGLDPQSETVKRIQKAFKDAGVEASIAASKSTEFAQALETSKRSFLELTNQYRITDPLVKFSIDSVSALTKLDTLLKGPILESIGGLTKVVEELDRNPIFGVDASRLVAQYKDEIVAVNNEINNTAKAANDARQQLNSLRAKGSTQVISEDAAAIPGAAGEFKQVVTIEYKTTAEYKAEEDRLKQKIQDAQRASAEAQVKAAELAALVNEQIAKGLTSSINTVASGINAALAKGSTQVLQALYSRIDNIPEIAQRQAELKLKELGIQQQSITAAKEMADATKLLTIAIARDTAQRTLQSLKEEAKTNPNIEASQLQAAQTEFDSLQKVYARFQAVIKDPVSGLNALNEELKSGDPIIKAWAQKVIEAAVSTAGFKAQLNDLARQAEIIKKIETPLAVEAAGSKARMEDLSRQQQDLEIRKQKVDIALQDKQITSEVAVFQKDFIERQQASVDRAKELEEAQTRYAQRLIIARGLEAEAASIKGKKLTEQQIADRDSLIKSAGLIRAEAEIAKNSASRLANEREALKLRNIDLNTLKQLQVIEKDRFDRAAQLLELETEIQKQRASTILETRDLQLQLLEAQGLTSERQLIALRAEQALRKESLALVNKLLDLEKRRAKELFDAQQKLDLLMASEGTTEQINAEIERIKLIRQSFTEQIEQEKQLSDLRSSNIQKLADLEASKQLREGLANAIETALFEGGKAGRKKLRDVIVAELRKPITLTIKAFVDTAFQGGLGSIFGFGGQPGVAGNPLASIGNIGSGISGLKTAYNALTGGLTSSIGSGLQSVAGFTGSSTLSSFAAGMQYSGVAAADLASAAMYTEAIGSTAASLGSTLAAAMPYLAAVAALYMLATSLEGGETRSGSTFSYSRTGDTPYMFGEMPYSSDLATAGGVRMISGPSGGAIGGEEGGRATQALFNSTVTTINSFFQELGSPARIDQFWGKLESSENARGGVLVGGMLTTGQTFGEVPLEGQSNYAGNLFEAYTAMSLSGEDALKAFTLDLQQAMLQALKSVSETLPPQIADLLSATDIELLTQEEVTNLINSIKTMKQLLDTADLLDIPLSKISRAMIEAAGGAENLNNSLNTYYQNFYTEDERRLKAQEAFNTTFNKLFEGTNIQIPTTRAEFRSLAETLLQTTDIAGRSGEELFGTLMTLGGAFAAITPAAEEATTSVESLADKLSNAGVNIEVFSDLIYRVISGELTGDNIGKAVADTIKMGVYKALSESFVTNVSTIIVNSLITPVLTSIVGGSSIAAALVEANFSDAIARIVAQSRALAAIFNNTEFQTALNTIIENVTTAITSFTTTVASSGFVQTLTDYTDRLKELNTQLDALRVRYQVTLLEEQIEALEDTKKPYQDIIDSLNIQKKTIQGQIKTIQNSKEAIQDQIDAINDQIDAINLQKDAINDVLETERDRNQQLKEQQSTLQETVDKFKNFTKSLKDFRASLLLSEYSPATPQQRYTTAQSALQSLYSRAMSGDEEAIGDIQSAASEFLDASRMYYASSDAYTADFNRVQELLDSVIGLTEGRASEAEQQLSTLDAIIRSSDSLITSLESQVSALDSQIKTYQGQIGSFSAQLKAYDSQIEAFNDQIQLIDDQIEQQNALIEPINRQISEIRTTISELQSVKQSSDDLAIEITKLETEISSLIATIAGQGTTAATVAASAVSTSPITYAEILTGTSTDYSYAEGVNSLPFDQVALVHQGERIIPAPDNREITNALTNKQETDQELIREIRRLNAKVDSLERTVAEGAIMNAQATDRNTTQISKSVKDAGSTATYTENIRRRTSVE